MATTLIVVVLSQARAKHVLSSLARADARNTKRAPNLTRSVPRGAPVTTMTPECVVVRRRIDD